MATKIETGEFLVDKEAACRQLIHSGIRLALSNTEPLLVHQAAIAAHDMLRRLAEYHGFGLTLDFDRLLKADLRPTFWRIYKDYNRFFKQPDDQQEDSLNISGILRWNDIILWINSKSFIDIFDYETTHMKVFSNFIITEYPHIIKINETIPEATKNAMKTTRSWSREERLSVLSEALMNLSEAHHEFEEDNAVTRYLESDKGRG